MKYLITLIALGFVLSHSASLSTAIAEDEKVDLKVGDDCPEFKMTGSDGKTYQLADFKQKKAFVVAWFPKAFTGGCTAQCKSFRENGKAIREFDVAYFTASVDPVEKNKEFAESLELDYPILSDPEKKAAKAFGVLSPRGVASRITIYVDKEGKIAFIDREVKAKEDAVNVAKKLDELKFDRKKG